MNSRERRKKEAEKHNLLYDEICAYKEDRFRYPEKYKINMTRKESRLLAMMSAMGGVIPYVR